MNINNILPLSLHRALCAAAVLMLAATSCYAQNAQTLSVFGESVNVSETARPEWRDANGKSVARLVLQNGDAAAWQINFRTLNLPEGAQMFLYGKDATTGATVSLHGPYEGHGPVNVPEFATEVIAGAAVTIEIQSPVRMQEWPFALDSAEKITAARLTELKQGGLVVNTRVQPKIRTVNASPDIRSAWVGNRLIQFEVIDGQAIFEGDVNLGSADEVGRQLSSKATQQKNGHITTVDPLDTYWPSGRVAYRIKYTGANAFMQGGSADLAVKAAVAYWNSRFPGILYTRTTEVNYVTVQFIPDAGCFADGAGRQLGEQFITIDNSCSSGNMVHEFGHVLGLQHEHTRPDRGGFVTVNWSNIVAGKAPQFQIPPAGESAASGAYNFGSIMHYGLTAFAKPGTASMTLIGSAPAGVTIGQRSALSAGDESTIRSLYCSGMTTHAPLLIELDFEAGGSTFTIAAPPYCTLNVTSTTSATWLKVTSTPTSPMVKFSVTANTGRYPRSASIYYNGRSTVVRQEGVGIFGKDF